MASDSTWCSWLALKGVLSGVQYVSDGSRARLRIREALTHYKGRARDALWSVRRLGLSGHGGIRLGRGYTDDKGSL